METEAAQVLGVEDHAEFTKQVQKISAEGIFRPVFIGPKSIP